MVDMFGVLRDYSWAQWSADRGMISMSKSNGGPAFARPKSPKGEYTDSDVPGAQTGMSLRDYMNIDWSKAPEDATHYAAPRDKHEGLWAKKVGAHWCYHKTTGNNGLWYAGVQPYPGEKFIPRPQEWTGEGLPPVGVICERRTHAEAQGGRYEQVKILAHTSKGFPVWENIDGMFAGVSKTQRMGDHPEFRPIRTPEQIAAKERSKECDKIYGILCKVEREGNRSDMAEALYDAGYRKVKDGDEK